MLLSLSFQSHIFLHAVDYGDFVYFFYREIAAEHTTWERYDLLWNVQCYIATGAKVHKTRTKK